ncbi:hypothetical protein SAMN05216273_1054 [Chryseobacterium taihuense]|uniref:Uncharacterized protein n=1 Tax=Chryseobacterium taihuense TaxID=1141221 RepID=A0ABY0QS48_9FLAO|nr:hypothetical protein SAMN05216273_1054 [Chryseobacterium taihuense]
MLEKQILTHINGIIIYRNFVESLPYNPLLIPLAKENWGFYRKSCFGNRSEIKLFTILILTDRELLETTLLIFM